MYRDIRYEEAKYRVKISHFTEKGHDITGVVHVGTNYGYEFEWYRKMGIEYFVGFEPLPPAIEEFKKNYPTLSTCKEFFFPLALGSRSTTSLIYQTQGDGQGSSFLKERDDSPIEKNVIVDSWLATIRRFDELVSELQPTLPINKLDCLVVDAQGMELDVLLGMGELLKGFKFLNIECSKTPVYDGEPPASQIVDFLKENGFDLDSIIEDHNDVMFIRRGIV